MPKQRQNNKTMNDLPDHVAIIPDGNRRWAKRSGLPSRKGHEKGNDRFREVANALFEHRVSYVTFWAASEDNLIKRSKHEIKLLTELLCTWMQKGLDSKEFVQNKIRFRFLGRWRHFLPDSGKLETTVSALETQTGHFTKRNLTILFGYDGRKEMLEAIKKMQLNPNGEADKESLENALWTGVLPDVDLVIRTGGEPHWSSGFMMWRTANSQFYFTKTFWPVFTKRQLEKALCDYSKRRKRLGK